MLPDKDIGCHRTGFEKTCYQCVTEHRCRLYQHIFGTDPQTGEPIDHYGCADEFRNKLIIDNTKEQRQTGASCDKVANEIDKFHKKMVSQNTQILRLRDLT